MTQDEENQDLNAKLEDLTNNLQRLQAEFDNYRKRGLQEKQLICERATEHLITKLLTIVDNFELALKAKDQGEHFVKGVQLIHDQLLSVLKEEGLERVPSEKFDPTMHEAIIAEVSDKEKDSILEVFQHGYSLKGKIIKPAKVKLAK